MKKNVLYFVVALLLISPLFLNAQKASDIEGIWYLHPDAQGRIPVAKIFSKNNKFYMYSFAYKNSKEILYDVKNPDSKLRSKPLKGMVILYGVKFDDGEWTGGKIYKPEDGKTYYATLKLSKDKNTINFKGSIDKYGFLGQSFTWTRAPQGKHQELSENEIRNPFGY